MKKIIFLIFIFVLMSISVSSDQIASYDAYSSDMKICFDFKDIRYSKPIVLVNNYTYIPLRETCEKFNVDAKWDKDTNEIHLVPAKSTNTKFKDDETVKTLFHMFFKIKPSENFVFENYEFGVQGEPYFSSKIIIPKSEFKLMENQLVFIEREKIPDSDYDYLSNVIRDNKHNSWWDLGAVDEADLVCVLPPCKGFYSLTVTRTIYVKKLTDGRVCLYVNY